MKEGKCKEAKESWLSSGRRVEVNNVKK